MALGSGGGAASLRLMSFRLPCSEKRAGVARVRSGGDLLPLPWLRLLGFDLACYG